MLRVYSLVLAVLLCGISALAQMQSATPPLTANTVMTSQAMSSQPMISLRGAVSIVAPCGQFYTTLGTTENLSAGAILQVFHCGCSMALAKVVKVDDLDSIAELLPPYSQVVVESGDTVLVQSNPAHRAGHCKRDFSPSCLQALICPGCGPRLPAIEPNMHQDGEEAFLGLTFLAAVFGTIVR